MPRKTTGSWVSTGLEGGGFSFEIATESADADRGRPLVWSDEAQQAKYPGDRGFEHLQIYKEGREVPWPP